MSVSLDLRPKWPQADNPVAALLVVVNLVDYNVVLLLATSVRV